jgi:formate-dependent nitrite reductase membrane component NrfD
MGPTGKRSVKELIHGGTAPVLWLGVVLAGIVIPLSIFTYNYFVRGASASLLMTAVCCVLIGLFSFNYCLLKGALYSPLTPT